MNELEVARDKASDAYLRASNFFLLGTTAAVIGVGFIGTVAIHEYFNDSTPFDIFGIDLHEYVSPTLAVGVTVAAIALIAVLRYNSNSKKGANDQASKDYNEANNDAWRRAGA